MSGSRLDGFASSDPRAASTIQRGALPVSTTEPQPSRLAPIVSTRVFSSDGENLRNHRTRWSDTAGV
jgi:hypothetical protein